MKVLNIKSIKLNDNWTVDSIRIDGTYSTLMEGNSHHPDVKKMFNKVIHKVTKNSSGFGGQALNQVPRFQPNELLKPIKRLRLK